jgi:DNA-directed RNA polymerase subunit K/omega
MDLEDDDYDESEHSDIDPDDMEIDYNTLYDDEDIDEDLPSGDESGDDEVLPENNHIKFNIISNNELYLNIEKKQKKLNPYLTNFEKIKVLSLRAEQIENNSPVLVEVPKYMTSSRDIAELEFREKKIPFMIRRYMGNEYEDWKLSEFLNY